MLELFVDALRHRVGQLITLSNLARDLEIAPKTAKNWLVLTEKMYITFAIYPFSERVLRSIQKPPKVYFYDNADVLSDEGARFENLVATTLLKRLQFMEDFHGYRCQLFYIRDKEGREVDFVTVKDGVVEELIEVKLTDCQPSSALQYFARHLKPKRAVQIVAHLPRSYHDKNILVTSALEYFHPGYYCTEIKG
jgi:predicted AAA+ superfamily ATPase